MEFEHLTAGRKLLAIEELLHPDFGDEASLRSCWLNWERAMERCAIQTGLHLPDDVKIAIVRRRAPDALRQHLQLTASSYEGRYPVFHDFVDAFWKARQGCEEDTSYSMDVSYMTDKGSVKGKSKGQLGLWQPRRQDKGFGKGSSAKGSMTKGSQKQKDLDKSKSKCFFCGRKGHTSAECRTGRVCYNCKKPGHTMKQCTAPRRTVQELEAEEAELVEDDEEGEHVMFMVESAKPLVDEGELHVGTKLMIAIDSGSEVHAIPF